MRTTPAASPHLVIRLEGVFDVLAARRLEAALARADAATPIHLDLALVREFHDLGIAVLAHAIASSPARVDVRGLRRHQLRVLRYFGVEAADPEPERALDAS